MATLGSPLSLIEKGADIDARTMLAEIHSNRMATGRLHRQVCRYKRAMMAHTCTGHVIAATLETVMALIMSGGWLLGTYDSRGISFQAGWAV
jgi:hypothetical protein